jgi:hypothetical protein
VLPDTSWILVPGKAPELGGMPSPSPIKRVLLGKTHVPGIPIVPAGKRIVEGGGLVIPVHGLGCVEEQVMLVGGVVKGRPRASMTAPVDG